MARIDDYVSAKKIAAEKLSSDAFENLIQRSGFEASDNQTFRIPFLDRVYLVSFPDFEFQDESDASKEIPIQEQVLMLHYMMAEYMPKISNKRIAYREIPGATFYFNVFVKRAIEPLSRLFGNNISGFAKTAEYLNAKAIPAGDAGFEFYVFPYVPLQLILWRGDEEFSSGANILFDRNIGEILSPEDVAWLSGMLVYRLIALSCKIDD